MERPTPLVYHSLFIVQFFLAFIVFFICFIHQTPSGLINLAKASNCAILTTVLSFMVIFIIYPMIDDSRVALWGHFCVGIKVVFRLLLRWTRLTAVNIWMCYYNATIGIIDYDVFMHLSATLKLTKLLQIQEEKTFYRSLFLRLAVRIGRITHRSALAAMYRGGDAVVGPSPPVPPTGREPTCR